MTTAELLQKMRQANEIASKAIEETDLAQSDKWHEANALEIAIQVELDRGGEGLLIEWSSAYSQYIIRAE